MIHILAISSLDIVENTLLYYLNVGTGPAYGTCAKMYNCYNL